MTPDCYTPAQIAEQTGLTVQTVRAYLTEQFPRHEYETWWRLTVEEYEFAVGQLRAARAIMFHQPRRILRRKQVMLPIF